MKLFVWVFSWIGGLSRNFGGGCAYFLPAPVRGLVFWVLGFWYCE